MTIDNRLSFHGHISSICKKVAKQLNALKRLQSFKNFTQRKVLAQSFVLADFNCCPTIWHFCCAKDQHKMEKVQERKLRFAYLAYPDYSSTYSELLWQGRILHVGAKTDSNQRRTIDPSKATCLSVILRVFPCVLRMAVL